MLFIKDCVFPYITYIQAFSTFLITLILFPIFNDKLFYIRTVCISQIVQRLSRRHSGSSRTIRSLSGQQGHLSASVATRLAPRVSRAWLPARGAICLTVPLSVRFAHLLLDFSPKCQWIVPQLLNLRQKNGEIYCICDNAYHKQEPCFPLFKLGQIVILP